MRKIRKIAGWLIMMTMAAAILYMGIGIRNILSVGPVTSFPWYAACYFTVYYFGPVILVELVIFALLSYYSGKRETDL